MKTKKKKIYSLGFYVGLYIFGFLIFLCNINSVAAAVSPTEKSSEVSREGLDTPEYLLARGLSLFYDHQWQQSKKYFSLHLEKFGDSELANRYLAQIAIIEGNMPLAKEYLQRGLKVDPESIDSLILLANIALHEQNDQAIAYFEKVLEIDPYNEEAIFSLAELYLKVKKDQYHAMGLYKRLIAAIQHNGGSSYQLVQIYNALGTYYTQRGEYRRAIFYFAKIEEFDPNNIRILFSLGQLYKVTGNLQKSIDYMQKIQALDYKHKPSLYSITESYYLTDSALAKAYAEAYMRRDGASSLIEGMNLEMDNKDSQAKEIFSSILSKHKNGLIQLSSRAGMSKIYQKEQDVKNLKSEAYRVILLAKQIEAYDLARNYSQIVFAILEQEQQAENFRQKFFYGNPNRLSTEQIKTAIDTIEFYSAYAGILEHLEEPFAALGYYSQSTRYIDRLLQMIKDSPNFLEEQKDADVKRSLSLLNAKKYQNLLSAALIHGQEKDYSSSYFLFKQAIALYPEQARGYFFRGIILYGQADKAKDKKMYNAAYENFAKAFELVKKDGDPPAAYYFYYGALTEKKYDLNKAEPLLKKAIELDPNNPTYLNFLGYMYSLYNRDLKEAQSLLIRALDDDLENHAYLDSLGWIFYQRGDFSHALTNLLMAEHFAEKNDIKDAVLYFHLGETYYRLGNNVMANMNYKKSLEFSADSSEELNVKYIKNMIAKTEKENNTTNSESENKTPMED